jgi:hypothetical protein
MREVCKECPARSWCLVYLYIFDTLANRLQEPGQRMRAMALHNACMHECLANLSFVNVDLEPQLAVLETFQRFGLPVPAA